jgi:hypothetical protein
VQLKVLRNVLSSSCNPSCSGGRDQEGCGSWPAQATSSRAPISKILNTKRAGGVAHVVELMPSKCEALSTKHSATKKKKKFTVFCNLTVRLLYFNTIFSLLEVLSFPYPHFMVSIFIMVSILFFFKLVVMSILVLHYLLKWK